MKPWSGLAAMMLLLAMLLYILSMSSSRWLTNSGPGIQRYMGPYEYCVDEWKSNVHECRSVDNSCSAMFSDPVGFEYSGSDCNKTRAVRAFLIMGLCFSALAFVASWLGYNSYDDILYRFFAIPLSLMGAICGLIAWALWTDMAQRDFGGDWKYSWAYGLSLAAWLLNLAAPLALLVPSPVRDKEALVGGRGSAPMRAAWRDMFTTSWWTKGADLGGRHDELPSRGGALGGAPGTTYESRAPLGTGYRETTTTTSSAPTSLRKDSPRAGTYGYGESEAERERLNRERDRERGSYGTSGGYSGTETETERLNRLDRERRSGESTGMASGLKSWLGGGSSSAHTHDTAPATTSSGGYGTTTV